MRKLFPLFFLGLLLFPFLSVNSQTISGELKKWHKITLEFDGPSTSESDTYNPFLNYRLNVTFTSPSGNQYLVPGFFAADGNAANSGANSGSKWQVRLAPDEIGTWTYTTSFRTGSNISISTNINAGNPVSFDGTTGSFNISASDKSGIDNRSKGRLKYVNQRYLQYSDSKEYFLKGGADSPENFLAYTDFDNTLNNAGPSYLKSWQPHVQDWNTGDPTWQTSKGKGIIGAVNYLASKGMNVFSFLTMNVNGDGDDVWPWVAPNDRNRYDVSKLEQWEVVFDHADKKGMYLHFKLQERENDQLLDGGNTATLRKLYLRELVARFGHHLALNWNIGEENDQTTQQQIDMADYLKLIDPYDHHIVMHTWPGEQDLRYTPLLGNNSELTGASIQTGITNVHNEIKKWIELSENTSRPWVVASDEIGPATVGVAADHDYSGDRGSQADNQEQVRKKTLWATFMAGGTGVEYYFGYQTGETDLSCQDLRSRNNMWSTTRIALDFFRTLPFENMQNHNDLTSVSSDYCFAKTDDIYVIYLPSGGTTNINLGNSGSTYDIDWFDPRNGGSTTKGSKSQTPSGNNVNIGNPPNNNTDDWVVVLKKNNSSGNSGSCQADFFEENGLVVMETENLNTSSSWTKENTVSGYTGSGYMVWKGVDHFNTPGNGLIQASIEINTPGTYRFQWRSKVGQGNSSTEHNDTWLRFPDADDFYAQKGSSIVYPKGSGKSPNPAGSGSDGWFKVYLSGTTDWTWSTKTYDNNSHDIFVRFDNPGVYIMEISARSAQHLIDRVVLHSNSSDPTNINNTETACDTTGGTPPDIRIDNSSRNEGSSVNFGAFLSTASNEDISFTCSFTDISTDAEDFDHSDITVTIPAGQTSTTISVPTTNDSEDESNETFSIYIKSVNNGTVNDFSDTAIGTIVDNDTTIIPPDLIIGNTTLIEGDQANFLVSLTEIAQEDIQITFALSNITSQTEDYNNSPITRTIFSGQNEITISVPTVDDTIEEADETFRLSVSSVDQGSLGDITNTGIATILDNDGTGPPDISVEDASVFEGDNVIFSVLLSNSYTEDITIDFRLVNDTANNSDYNANSVSLTIPSGQTEGILSIETYDDTIFEGDESFILEISGISEGTAGNIEDTARAIIIDNDTPPNVIIANASANEGSVITFDVNLDESSIEDITLEFTISLGTADNSDLNVENIEVTIPAGNTTVSFEVITLQDTEKEDNETFFVAISSVKQGSIGDSSDTATGIIIDDDGFSFPSIILEDASASEGEILKIPVKLTEASENEISMTFTFVNNTGSEDDYSYTSASVSIPAGETEASLDILLLEDDLLEEKETFNVLVAKIDQGQVNEANDSATATIIDATGELLDFDLYPNPAKNGNPVYLTGLKEGSFYTITFSTMRGKLLFEQEIEYTGNYMVPVPSGLKKGVYLLSVYKDGEISSEKIVIN